MNFDKSFCARPALLFSSLLSSPPAGQTDFSTDTFTKQMMFTAAGFTVRVSPIAAARN